MMHSFLVGAVYVAIVLAPCVVALFTGIDTTDDPAESNVYEDGFI
jgi:hypothetical protein